MDAFTGSTGNCPFLSQKKTIVTCISESGEDVSGLLEEYERFLAAEKQYAQNTVQSYLWDARQFERYLEAYSSDLLSATRDDVETYLENLKETGKASATARRFISSIRVLYRWLVFHGKLIDTPVRISVVEPPKDLENSSLSPEQIQLILQQPRTVDAVGVRDKAFLDLVFTTGLRVSELVALHITDVRLESGELHCFSEKSERLIRLSPAVLEDLQNYLQKGRRVFCSHEHETALFVNLRGGRLSRQGAWKMLEEYAKKAEIPVKITFPVIYRSVAEWQESVS